MPDPTGPADAAERGLCPSSTWPLQGSMVQGRRLQLPRNSPSAVPVFGPRLVGVPARTPQPRYTQEGHQLRIPEYLLVLPPPVFRPHPF